MFLLSVEVTEGNSFIHGFHLGYDEAEARALAVERFLGRVGWGLPVVTVALLRNGKVFDTFYGSYWHSEIGED
jgi:hypothetical protein